MMIYIASPYTSKDPTIMTYRYMKVREFTAEGLKEGFILYSPIVHCHPMAEAHNMPRDFQFWSDYNIQMISASKEVIILQLPGWEESRGIVEEISYCKSAEIPILSWTPESCGDSYPDLCRTFWKWLKNTRREERMDLF
jgi:Domain of unknown function (DUF1937)